MMRVEYIVAMLVLVLVMEVVVPILLKGSFWTIMSVSAILLAALVAFDNAYGVEIDATWEVGINNLGLLILGMTLGLAFAKEPKKRGG